MSDREQPDPTHETPPPSLHRIQKRGLRALAEALLAYGTTTPDVASEAMRPLPRGMDCRIPTVNVIRRAKRELGVVRVRPRKSRRRTREAVCWSYRATDPALLQTWLARNPAEPDDGPKQRVLF
jgi:hypothetical protein